MPPPLPQGKVTTPDLPITLRRASKRDLNLITSSWLKSFRDASFPAGCPNRIFFYYHHKILETLIPRSIVMVACSETDPDQILGWICAELMDNALVVHYAYTKHPFRRWGICKLLVDTLIESEKPVALMYTHQTPSSKKVLKDNKEWIYHPYLAFLTLPQGWQG